MSRPRLDAATDAAIAVLAEDVRKIVGVTMSTAQIIELLVASCPGAHVLVGEPKEWTESTVRTKVDQPGPKWTSRDQSGPAGTKVDQRGPKRSSRQTEENQQLDCVRSKTVHDGPKRSSQSSSSGIYSLRSDDGAAVQRRPPGEPEFLAVIDLYNSHLGDVIQPVTHRGSTSDRQWIERAWISYHADDMIGAFGEAFAKAADLGAEVLRGELKIATLTQLLKPSQRERADGPKIWRILQGSLPVSKAHDRAQELPERWAKYD